VDAGTIQAWTRLYVPFECACGRAYYRLARMSDTKLDRRLACLVALAVERWGDEWLTPGQVAETHGVGHQDVNRYIHAGKLPGVKWGNWRIRRSDAKRVYFHKGREAGYELD